MSSYIDTHTHLYVPEFDEDRDAVVNNAMQAGVTRMFLPNIDAGTIGAMMQLAGQYPNNCFPMMGLHPGSVKENVSDELAVVKEWLFEKQHEVPGGRWAAVGEIGLDYYWDTTYKAEQQMAFRQQIEWAKQLGLPIAIHTRDAMEDVLSTLEEMHDERLRGVLHCFTGTVADAKRAIDLGFYLGIGGVVTFKNSGLDKMVAELPLESLVLETDSPYLAPTPNRGKRNETSYIVLVAEKLATVYQLPLETIQNKTTENALQLFEMQDL